MSSGFNYFITSSPKCEATNILWLILSGLGYLLRWSGRVQPLCLGEGDFKQLTSALQRAGHIATGQVLCISLAGVQTSIRISVLSGWGSHALGHSHYLAICVSSLGDISLNIPNFNGVFLQHLPWVLSLCMFVLILVFNFHLIPSTFDGGVSLTFIQSY